MKYFSYKLKFSGGEGLQPLALFVKWPFQNGIPFKDRLVVAISTNEDLSQLILEGKEFDMREEKEQDVLSVIATGTRAYGQLLRRQADTSDLHAAAIEIKIAELEKAAEFIM